MAPAVSRALKVVAKAIGGMLGVLLLAELVLQLAARRPADTTAAVATSQEAPDGKPVTRRILCLGDSFTYGIGVSRDESYPTYLGRLVAARGWEVVNGGWPGANSTQVALKLEGWLARQRIDDVVVMTGINNYFNTIGGTYQKLRPLYPARNGAERTFRVLDGALEWSRVYRFVRLAVTGQPQPGAEPIGTENLRREPLAFEDWQGTSGTADAINAFWNKVRADQPREAAAAAIAVFERVREFESLDQTHLNVLKRARELMDAGERARLDAVLHERLTPDQYRVFAEDPDWIGANPTIEDAWLAHDLDTMARLTRAAGVRLIVMSYPNGAGTLDPLRAAARRHPGVVFLDLRDACAGPDCMLPDLHMTARGNEAIAKRVLHQLDGGAPAPAPAPGAVPVPAPTDASTTADRR